MNITMVIAVEMLSACFDVLFWATIIYIGAQAGVSNYIVDRNLSGKAAKEATRVLFVHQVILAALAWQLMRWFIWNPPEFIPAVVAYPAVAAALTCIIKVASIAPRVNLFIFHAELEARLTQDQAPT
ncbi:MAG: hypothetical protein ACREGE_00540 [Candidatus Microsaccharimonas sp.]